MSILPQKLKVKKDGITEEINIYDNQPDVGSDFIRAGGGYVKLGTITDPSASRIRVLSKGKIKSLLKTSISGKRINLEDGNLFLEERLAPNILCRITDLEDGFTALIKTPSSRPYKLIAIHNFFESTSAGSGISTYMYIDSYDWDGISIAMRYANVNVEAPTYKSNGRRSLFEYPVQDDGVSPMWDMNQIVYEYGQPRGKKVR